MKLPRIMVVCGFGLGSSMVLKLRLDEVLQKHGLKADTFCSDAITAPSEKFDAVFTSKEMEHLFKSSPKPMVVITNFLNRAEIEEKGIPVVRQLVEG